MGSAEHPGPLLEIHDLAKTYRVRHSMGHLETVRGADGVSLSIDAGRTLGLVGESGSGKSTIARCVLGLTRPTAGEIRFGGERLDGLRPRAMRRMRRRVQIVFQNPQRSFDPLRSIRYSVAEIMNVRPEWSKMQRRERVQEVLHAVNLGEELWHRRPDSLSGGQLQRAAIARAIAPEPELVVLDEPTSALDMSVRGEVLSLLRRLQEELGVAYLFISHDLEVVRAVAHDVAVMYLGQIVERAPAGKLFRMPAHPYTQALLTASAIEGYQVMLSARTDGSSSETHGCRLRDRCPLAEQRCAETQALRPLHPDHEARCWKSPVPVDAATSRASGDD